MKTPTRIALNRSQCRFIASKWPLELLNLLESFIEKFNDPKFDESGVSTFFRDMRSTISALYRENKRPHTSSDLQHFLCCSCLSRHPQSKRIRPWLASFYFLVGAEFDAQARLNRLENEVEEFKELNRLSDREFLKRREERRGMGVTIGMYR